MYWMSQSCVFDSLLDEWAIRVHLHSVQMSLSQTQTREGQQRPDVGADSGQAQLHRQLGHWDPAGSRNQDDQVCPDGIWIITEQTQILTTTRRSPAAWQTPPGC